MRRQPLPGVIQWMRFVVKWLTEEQNSESRSQESEEKKSRNDVSPSFSF
jgi:hypothetical protein